MLAPPGFEPQVRADRQDVSRACGPADLRETSEDCQRQPQLNPGVWSCPTLATPARF